MCFLSCQAPSSLLEALEQHLASLEGKKVKDSTAASRYVDLPLAVPEFLFCFPWNSEAIFSRSTNINSKTVCYLNNENLIRYQINQVIVNLFFPCRASTLSNAVSSLASTGMSFTKVDEREKQAALEEEQARLKALKVALSFRELQLVS